MTIDTTAPGGVARPGASAAKDATDSRAARRDHMAVLLQSYPDVTPDEQRALADFLKTGSPDDLALVTYGEGLAGKAAAFKKEHPEHFGSGGRLILAWALFLAAFAALMIGLPMLF